MKAAKIKLAMLFALLAVHIAFAGDSAPIVLDTMDGTRIARAAERIAYSTEWNGGSSVRVAADGSTLKTASAPASGEVVWNASAAGVGGHVLTHVCGGETLTAHFAVFGDDVGVVSGGRLAASETWSADKTWLVMQPLTVASGATLTIEKGAVVKFMPGASLTVASGGLCYAYGSVFTHVNDDTIGGDTLFDGDATQPVIGGYTISGSIYDDDETEYRYMPPQTLTSNISYDTRLRGYRTYIVSNSVTVASGATLTLQPGTILKFASGCQMTVNGTLDAQGTRAAPIVFTSLKDDEHGGDTNADGDKTYAQPGDWAAINAYGTLKFNYASILYGGNNGSSTADVILLNGGNVTFDNSNLAHAYQYGVGLESGSWVMRNSCFSDFHTAFRHFASCSCINSVFYDFTYLSNNGGQTFKNCVISRFNTALCWWTDNCTYRNCVIWNPVGFGPQSSDKVGSNGNIWGDPQFADPDNGDFTIAATSPCVDAGDGTVAPETDYWGRPRMDVKAVADTGKPNADGVCPDIGICEVDGESVTPLPDLAVLSVATSATLPVSAGDELTVTYVVTNRGAAAASGTWRDTVTFFSDYGTEGTALTSETTANLVAGGVAATFTKKVRVPAVAEGEWGVRVEANAYRDVAEISLTDNNRCQSETRIAVSLAASSLTESFNDKIRKGEPIVKKYSAAGGDYALEITAASGATIDYGTGAMPSGANAVTVGPGGIAYVSIPAGEMVYVTISGDKEGAVSIRPFAAGMTVRTVSPAMLPQSGEATLTVDGLHLGDVSSIRLVNGSKSVSAKSLRVEKAERLTAKFDCSELSAGTKYALVVETDDGANAQLANAVTVTGVKGEAKLSAKLEMPISLRQGRSFVFYIDYANTGNIDMPAPIFTVKSDQMIFTTDYGTYTNSVKLIGLGAAGSAGVIRAGESFRLPVRAQVKPSASGGVKYSLSSSWTGSEGAERKLHLESIASAQWVYDKYSENIELYDEVCSRVGKTWGDFYYNLSAHISDADDGELGVLTFDRAVESFLSSVYADIRYAESINAKSTKGKRLLSLASNETPLQKCQRIHKDAEPLTGNGTADVFRDNSDPGDLWEYCRDCGWWHKVQGDISYAGREVVVIAHGLNDSIHGQEMLDTAIAFDAQNKGFIVLGVDHGDDMNTKLSGDGCAKRDPNSAAKKIPQTSTVAYGNLVRHGVEAGRLTLVGHSHGGHFTGRIAALYRRFQATPKRLIGLDTSPVYTHPKNDRFPNAWGTASASRVELYKSSWWYSLGKDNTDEVYGRPSFFLVEGAGLFRADNPANFNNTDQDSAVHHHSYCRSWLIGQLYDSESPLWASKDGEEIYREFTGLDGDYPQQTFAGVIRGNIMECGKHLRDKLIEEFGITKDSWRLEKALGTPATMRALQDANARLTEYHLDNFGIWGKGGSDELTIGEETLVRLDGYNAADNVSTDFESWLGKARITAWDLGDKTGIGMQVWAIELTENDPLIEKYSVGAKLTKTEVEVLAYRAKCAVFDNKTGRGDNYFSYPVEGNVKQKFKPVSIKKLSLEFNGRKVGYRADNSTVLEEGEKVLFIAMAGALRNIKTKDTEIRFYPYDLCHDDDCYAVVRTVKAGDVSAFVSDGVASISFWPFSPRTVNLLRSSPLLAKANDGYSISDNNTYQADEFGRWTIQLTGVNSFSPTNIVSGMWTSEDCNLSSIGWSENPNVTASGVLPRSSDGEFVPSIDYKVSLQVKDAKGNIDNVEHTFTIYRKTNDDAGDDNGGGSTPVPQSCDPNEVLGPDGLLAARYVQPGEWLNYTIFFENKSDASAAAQFVTVDNPLSGCLDWSSFEMGDVGFGTQIDTGLMGKKNGTSEVTMDGTNLAVRTEVTMDEDTGKVSWFLRIVSPYGDSDGWPYADDSTGFLPPNDETHRGEGHLTYRIKVRDDAPAGVVITNSATIVFDYNEPIETNPAWWNTVAQMASVTFDGGAFEGRELIVGEPYGELPEPAARTGYKFGGWYTGPNGTGRKITAQSIVQSGDSKLYEHWTANTYTVTFDAAGGYGGWSRKMDYGEEIVVPPVTKEGYVFAGWSPATGQRPVVPAHDVTFVAQWEVKERTWIAEDEDAVPSLAAASVWDGWVVENQGSSVNGQEVKGVVQVKVGKANKRTGEAKVTASVTMLGERKQTVKMTPITADNLECAGTAKDGTAVRLEFGVRELRGSYGAYEIVGAVNGFVSKDKAAKASAEEVLAPWLGPVNVAWPGEDGWNTLSVIIARKGKAKAAGALWDGTKLTGAAQVAQGDEWSAVPVLVTKKVPMAFMLLLGDDGTTIETDGLPDGAVAGRPGTLAAGSALEVDADAFAAALGDATFKDYLPDGVEVMQNGKKLAVAKGGKVVYVKGTTEVDEAKAGENPAALKLTYTQKTGAFKGSFKAYIEAKGKPKALTAKIVGVLVDGVAYGTATIKKVLGIGVRIL